jgi:hypothetical protein
LKPRKNNLCSGKNAYERYKYADANLKLASTNIDLLHEAFVNGVADNRDLILVKMIFMKTRQDILMNYGPDAK